MKKAFLLFFILFTFFWSNTSFPITPDDVVWRAYGFAHLHWYCSEENTVSPYDPSYQSEFTVGWHSGEAYKWGGYDDESQFTTKIANGYAAGYPWNDRVVDWACGIDCSGLVSRCWALAWKYGTWHLDNISVPVSWDNLQQGDILLKPGSHVIIFDQWYSPGVISGFDASVEVYPARVDWREFQKDVLESWGYSPKRYVNFVTEPDIPPGGHMTWGQIKALFSGSWNDATGFWSYGKFYSRGPYGTEAFNGRCLFWDHFDPEASGYDGFKSLPTNSDYFSFFATASKGGIYGEFLDSSDLDLLSTESDFYYGDPLYDGGGAPYFYKVASYFADPFQLNYYSDELYTKSIGIGMDSVAKYSWDEPWATHFDLATINDRDYLFFPSMQNDPIAIYDVTDIRNRQKIGELSLWNYVTDVAVKDTLCFAIEDWGTFGDVAIWNVADPTNPIFMNWWLEYDFYPLKIEIGDQRLFIFCTDADPYHENQYVVKGNISDPTNPYQEGVIQVGDYYHKANDMIVAGPYIYVSRENFGLMIYECEDLDYVASYPSVPVDTLAYHSIDYQNGKIYAIKTTPDGSFTNVFLDIIDVSDPAHAFLISSSYIFELSPLDPPYQGGLCIQGDYVYLNAFSFLSIFDVSNVTDMYLTERIKPCPMVDTIGHSEIVEHGDVNTKGDRVFGLFAQSCCSPGRPICFSGFYSVQTFGLETDVIVIGDPNADGYIEMGDILFLISYLFKNGPRSFPYSLGEVNADGVIDLGDILYLISYLYKGGPQPTKIYVGPSEYQASLSFGKFEADTDKVLDIPIICEADGPVAGVQLEIDYDPGGTELFPPVLTANTRDLDLFYSEDYKRIGLLDLTGEKMVPNGDILHLRFKDKGSSTSPHLGIKVNEAILGDPQGRILKVEILNSVAGSSTKPKEFQLSQNYPNPFNPTTMIDYTLPSDCKVKLTIYNILGQKVRTLIDSYQKAGSQRIIWDGKNDYGKESASGIYFYRLKAGEFSDVKKMTIIK